MQAISDFFAWLFTNKTGVIFLRGTWNKRKDD